ncbi:MAG: LegC family aminotransferase [Endomicrobium sp.]|jgi:perosamine synthetase|nr:LegC family aminotransferase [Endomicrobium sp.]
MQNKFIPLSVPNIKGNELKYVTNAIKTEWVSTAGADIKTFEENFAKYLNVPYSCAVQSGTAGLHLCLRHFGISQGDIVLVPSLTFIATVNPVIYQNAEPVFFDCDDNMCLDPVQVEKYLSEECSFDGEKTFEKNSKKQVKAVMPVHIFGDTCDMDKIMQLAEKYKLIVIEDATESLGTKFISENYKGKYTGTAGHAGVFSFNGNKIITTGGGGMVVSNDEFCIKHIKYLSQQAKDDDVYFINNEVGYNYRMTNIQAALGIAQLEQLDSFIEIKKNNHKLYGKLLKNSKGVEFVNFHAADYANYWFYSLKIKSGDISVRDKFIKYMSENKVQVRPLWKLNHTQKPFLHFKKTDCSNAEKFYKQIVNIPCSSNLSEEDVERVCSLISNFDFGGK